MPSKQRSLQCSCYTILVAVCLLHFLFIYLLLKYSLKLETPDYPHLSAERGKRFESFPTVLTSSVYCIGETKYDRQCRFRNLCFSKEKDKYLFIRTDDSVMLGLPEEYNAIPVIDFSSVDDHNAMYFNFREVTQESIMQYSIDYIDRTTILFKRFNPENLMHVLHDDIIPLFKTMRKFFLTSDQIQLAFMEGREEGAYFELYKLLSDNILMLQNISSSGLTCFLDVIVGLCKETTWYQYGFREPQGPLNVENYSELELEYFRKFVLSQIALRTVPSFGENEDSISNFVLYFSRSISRKIVNEMQLVFRLSSYFKVPIHTVSLEHDDIFEIISLVSKASVFIGIHGAHLSLAMFMKSNATLVELFPFAIPASNYKPYRTLAQLKSLRYIFWENKNENNTITHESNPPNLGGIHHLPLDLQESIRNTKIVPPHLCCHDPFWLFRIYQDTRVDINNLLTLLESEFKT